MTHLLVVSRESVCTAFLLVGLNDLKVSACDTLGAHLNAPAGEKMWFAAGPECGVDEGSVGDPINNRSQTRVMMFVKSAPVTWHSKRQGTVEVSVFGAEFVVLCVGMEMNEGLQCKLQLMGVPIGGLSNLCCNNQSAVDNSMLPESQLKKKHLSTCHHCICECCTKQAAQAAFESTETNVADLCTKASSADRCRKLCERPLC